MENLLIKTLLKLGLNGHKLSKYLTQVVQTNRLIIVNAIKNLILLQLEIQLSEKTYHCLPEPRGPPANIINRGIILAAVCQDKRNKKLRTSQKILIKC